MEKEKLRSIIDCFDLVSSAAPYGNGHINDTYLFGTSPGFILQRINANVFKEPEKVMSNIEMVTAHLREEILKDGGDPSRETLNLIFARDGKSFVKTSEGDYFRMYDYINGTVCHETAENAGQLFEAGCIFGKFQRMLDGFSPGALFDTIPDFHNTPKRVKAFHDAIRNDKAGRAALCREEIQGFCSFEKYACIITDALFKKEIPERVTHNDTKLNNVLFDKETDKAICVIDLDTVMSGSLLYDYGDALRFGASSAAEDERSLSKVFFDLDKFESFTKGFISGAKGSISEKELELMPISALIMTFECGIRFLTDHLDGDIYFKIRRKEHNLDRARTQLKLLCDMEQKLDAMKKTVYGCAAAAPL